MRLQAQAEQDLEAIVALAWERTLPPGISTAERSFEDAGGDSALLMQFFFFLEELCGRNLPMEGFELAMTPADFVAYLAASLDAPQSPPPPSAPLFLMPGRGADEPRLARFRQACEAAITMRTLAYPDWQRMVEPGFTIDVLAEELAGVIASESGEGAVKLAGYSYGGHVALATARHLVARGRAVGLVAILDANALQLDNFETAPVRRAPLGQRLARILRSAMGADGGEYCARVLSDTLAQAHWAPVLRALRGVPFAWAPRSFRYHLIAHLRMALRVRLLRQWHAGPSAAAARIDAPVFLFRSDETRAHASEDLGWRGFCANLAVVPIPGSHLGIFDDANVAVLVERFLAVVTPPRGGAG
jgi:thioesterase domain-containing protein/acyl carrier protein